MIKRNSRIVFLGDSITEGYGVSRGECWIDALPGQNINHGISGDTTAGMLRRFTAHVLREKPDYVVIMGGINDLSEGRSLQSVRENLQAMYERAEMRDIIVIPAVCVMPDYDMVLENDWAAYYPGIADLPEKLEQLAAWIRRYAEEHQLLCLVFAQYFPNYTANEYYRYFSDGVHPNERGHAIMADIAKKLLYGTT
ncbi:MAG: GDSL-type esterase/lipase family protein [Clostridia bacterium]|nr:GDSL-type esterase/lipase family protein [Clostridia bacterium]